MKTVRVKICGITNHGDAALAVRMGVDALGFIFADSPRKIGAEKAKDIIGRLPPFITTVGVFVNESAEMIKDISRLCRLDMLQLHGEEGAEFCSLWMPRVIKSFRVKGISSIQKIGLYRGKISALLLDSYEKGIKGGTGKVFDWNLAVLAKDTGMPVILSGGIGPANVIDAIQKVRPWAVDVNSAVEKYPGKKDPLLLKDFMSKVRNTEHSIGAMR